MKKVSVVIPIYNTEEYLQECISSVIRQTYKNLEILLINDGSDESCKQEIESIAQTDERISVYHHSEPKGVGAARNLGMDKATGDYVYFIDSDDFIPTNTIQLMVENIGEHEILSGKIKKISKKELLQLDDVEVKLNEKANPMRIFENNTMLHRLISLSFLRENGIRFSEEVQVYADLPVTVAMMSLLEKTAYSPTCLYYKRVRNDPIDKPALMQLGREVKIRDYTKIFNQLRDKYTGNEKLEKFLDKQFLNFYRRTIIMILSEEDKVDEYFPIVAESAKRVHERAIKKLNFVVKLELQYLQQNKIEKFKSWIRTHHTLRNIKRAFKSKRHFYIYLYRNLFQKMQLKEKTIVFESFLGKNYSDSPKNIYEYMAENNKDYNFVWIFNEPKTKKIPGKAKLVKRFSFKYYYYLATAKYWVSNSRMPLHLDKREGNVYLQTWHGTPLKRLVFDMQDVYSANPQYKKHFYSQSRRWDYLISANQYSTDIFRRAFKFEKEMLEFGYPRNDVLHSPQRDEMARQIKESIGIPLDKKVVLYAPTWRDDEFYESGKYKFNLQLDLQKMKERLGDEYVVLLRMHYFIADNIETTGVEDFAYNLSKYNDIADLYLISDILITDYSSVFFDYSNLKRPILFFTYDLEKYRDTLRGFYIDMEKELPGPLLKTSDQVIDAIENIDQVSVDYKEKYDQFYHKICEWETGHATEQVVKRVWGE